MQQRYNCWMNKYKECETLGTKPADNRKIIIVSQAEVLKCFKEPSNKMVQWDQLRPDQSLQSRILAMLMAPTKDEEEDSESTVDPSGIQGQGMPGETKIDMKQDQKTQNEPNTAVASAMTTEGSSELEATVVTVVEEVQETDVEGVKPDHGAVVETVVKAEESESRTRSNVVTDSGTGSQRDWWMQIGRHASKGQTNAYEAAAMIHLALVSSSPELQKLSPLFERQVTHRRVKRGQFMFKNQKGCGVLEVTPTQWKQLKEGEVYEVNSIQRNRTPQKKQMLNSPREVTKDQGRPMETAKVTPDQDEENQPGLKDVMQRQQLLQHQDMQRLMIQKQEQELQHELKKQEQELRFKEHELQSEAKIMIRKQEQELQHELKKQEQELRFREQEFHVKEPEC